MHASINRKIVLGSLMLFLGGTLAGILLNHFSESQANRRGGDDAAFLSSFTNPTVSEEQRKHFIINFKSLREQLQAIQSKYAQKTFIYFAYLNNASWTGLNEREMFTAASTIKVPLAMSIMKAVEEGRLTLDQSYSLDELDLDANFGTLYQVGAEKEFSIQRLMEIMLAQSDNTAMNALFRVLKNIGIADPLSDVYAAMGWDVVPNIGEAPQYIKINLKTLSNMFLALYNAQYVNDYHSNKILSYLAQSPFNDALEAGIPSGVPVAHKIGVYDPDQTYSDCGIVYAPVRNYLLCLGSTGVPEAQANTFMAEVSKAAYTFVINH